MSNAKVNIIGASAYSSTGGIQAVNRLLVDELLASETLRKAYFLWDRPSDFAPAARTLVDQGLVQGYNLDHPAFLRDLLLAAARHPTDRWLCTHVNYSSIGLMLTALRSRNLAVILHAAELDEHMTRLKRFALRRTGFIITVSEFTKRKALRLGVNGKRIHIVPNGIPDPCPNWTAPPSVGDTQQLIFVGRMDERYKGQIELLEAMQLLRHRYPKLRLVFIGGGRTLAEWRKEAASRGLEQIVAFAGRVSDEQLHKYYRTSLAFAMPSHNEGFGLVYAEAMAHGLPCIGSDRDAACEVIAQDETGQCVPAGNATALADCISELIKSPQRRHRWGLASRQRFVDYFCQPRYSERLDSTVQRWLSGC